MHLQHGDSSFLLFFGDLSPNIFTCSYLIAHLDTITLALFTVLFFNAFTIIAIKISKHQILYTSKHPMMYASIQLILARYVMVKKKQQCSTGIES